MKMAKDANKAVSNPLDFYRIHSDDVSTISRAINTGQKINAAQSSKDKVGVGLRSNYSPPVGFTIHAGVIIKF